MTNLASLTNTLSNFIKTAKVNDVKQKSKLKLKKMPKMKSSASSHPFGVNNYIKK